MAVHRIAPGVTLDDDDVVVEGIRASGPGGQNVNKVSSAIALRLDLGRVAGMDEGIRASGPGGQNVNKVSSAIALRLDLGRVAGMDEGMRARLLALAGRRVTEGGVLVIKAQSHRTQVANRADALARVLDLLRAAAIAPRKRVPTRATAGSRARRLDSKRRRSLTKSRRSLAPGEEP